MPGALVTGVADGLASIDQPTTRLGKASSTTAQWILPPPDRVLGDVDHLEAVRMVTVELALDEV
jgi:hypothetical protein